MEATLRFHRVYYLYDNMTDRGHGPFYEKAWNLLSIRSRIGQAQQSCCSEKMKSGGWSQYDV
jgi:hypothetical protein